MSLGINFKKNIDNLGILLSSICAVHCALLPILILVFPAVSIFLSDREELTHILIFVFTLPAVFFAFYSMLRIHGEKTPLYFILPGLALVFIGTFVVHSVVGHIWEPLFVVVGSLLMLRGHLLNKRHCERCHSCTEKFAPESRPVKE
jgi:hypothetical protein